MTLTKTCDSCGKILMSEEDKEFIFSTWRIYHFKKIRDFCSNECFLKWFKEYFKDKNKDDCEDLIKNISDMIKKFEVEKTLSEMKKC